MSLKKRWVKLLVHTIATSMSLEFRLHRLQLLVANPECQAMFLVASLDILASMAS